MPPDEDSELLAALRDDDADVRRGAEHALFLRFREPVERLMGRLLGADHDDCLQEVFVDVFRGVRSFEGHSLLSTWVYRVALRRGWKCAAARRRQQRGREDGERLIEQAPARDGASDVPAQLEAEELARRFGEALQRLDLDQRTVLALTALDGLGPAEISDILGAPVGTVHSRLSRARARVRELLGLTH